MHCTKDAAAAKGSNCDTALCASNTDLRILVADPTNVRALYSTQCIGSGCFFAAMARPRNQLVHKSQALCDTLRAGPPSSHRDTSSQRALTGCIKLLYTPRLDDMASVTRAVDGGEASELSASGATYVGGAVLSTQTWYQEWPV